MDLNYYSFLGGNGFAMVTTGAQPLPDPSTLSKHLSLSLPPSLFLLQVVLFGHVISIASPSSTISLHPLDLQSNNSIP